MIKKNTLLRTNIIVCAIITIGFIITSVIGYQSNTDLFEKDIEQVSTLATEGLYFQIDKIFSESINVSLAMANDNMLKDFLTTESQHLDDEAYTKQLRDYLNTYKEKYSYDSVFLISTLTNRYYHFNGIDRVLTTDNPENKWYYDALKNNDEYTLNIDNDETTDDSITTFVNCKIKSTDGSTLGIIGVGLKVDSLQSLLKEYDEKFDVKACLVNGQGEIQLSSDKTGYEHINLFNNNGLAALKDSILGNKGENGEQKSFWHTSEKTKNYIVSQYVPNLKWHLVVENNMSAMSSLLHMQLHKGIAIIAIIIILVLFTITRVLKQYKAKIINLSVPQKQEYQKLLNEATAQLYENIFEINITKNNGGEKMVQYFEKLGMAKGTPYDEGIRGIARLEIKEEYAQGYLDLFLPEQVLNSYNNGINNLSYDFLVVGEEEDSYRWIRISARIFYWESDKSVHMISYRKNIDTEKRRELVLIEKSQIDSLSGLYNKGVTEKIITDILAAECQDSRNHALLILDIDNFKHVNDKYGHIFGDSVIAEFSAELKHHFRDTDIVGRIGGDEFAVLMIDSNNISMFTKKMERFCARIALKDFGQKKGTQISCTIGAALYPEHGITYSQLYEKADQALYYAKAHGKRSFHIIDNSPYDSAEFHVDYSDFKEIIENTTDGVCKFAATEPLKTLYFNENLLRLLGYTIQESPSADINPFSFIHPDDVYIVKEELKNALPERKPMSATFRLKHKDGHYFQVKLRGFFINELYQDHYPVFYVVYTDLSGFIPQE